MKRGLTHGKVDMKVGHQRKGHKGRAVGLHRVLKPPVPMIIAPSGVLLRDCGQPMDRLQL